MNNSNFCYKKLNKNIKTKKKRYKYGCNSFSRKKRMWYLEKIKDLRARFTNSNSDHNTFSNNNHKNRWSNDIYLDDYM